MVCLRGHANQLQGSGAQRGGVKAHASAHARQSAATPPPWPPDLLLEVLLLMAGPRLLLRQHPALLLPDSQTLLCAALLMQRRRWRQLGCTASCVGLAPRHLWRPWYAVSRSTRRDEHITVCVAAAWAVGRRLAAVRLLQPLSSRGGSASRRRARPAENAGRGVATCRAAGCRHAQLRGARRGYRAAAATGC